MNKTVIFLVILAFLTLLLPSPSPAQMNVQIEQGQGFVSLKTPTLSIGTNTPVKMPSLPQNTKNVYITAYNGSLYVGGPDSSSLASGSMPVYAGIIASGTTVKLDGIYTQNPNIYFLSLLGTVTAKIVGWGNP